MVTPDAKQRVVKSLLVSNLVSVVLFGLRVAGTHNSTYWFLFWNLVLGWVPVLIMWTLLKSLKTHSWKEPLPVLLTLLWLGFLPNSFYLMSDLIHLQSTGDIGILFDVVLFLSCIWNGVIAGMLSVYMAHRELVKRFSTNVSNSLITGVFLLTSLAIYLGRTLRWNTWDVIINPAGLLFDVSERIINPLDHPQFLVTTLTFFVLLGSMYYVVYSFACALESTYHKSK